VNNTALPHVYSGKVRELYEVGLDRFLMVATDRVSVFDVVLPDEIPDKGRVLTGLSHYWFDKTRDIVPNHVISCDPTDFPETAGDVAGRAMLVRATRPVRLECVVRGYLFGSAWKEYTERGTLGGLPMPDGMREAEALPAPMFTPTTKAEVGDKDMPLTEYEAIELVGGTQYEQLRDHSIALYQLGARHAHDCGLILADTKFEFGDLDGTILVIDEMMTPDSSRYWLADEYRVGESPPSFDKQYVRDFMHATGWNHEPPAPAMTPEAIANTRARYRAAYERITGESLDDWFGPEDE
jgi:phosphoribosylaminoimidazole-succinocarboxamide synthase